MTRMDVPLPNEAGLNVPEIVQLEAALSKSQLSVLLGFRVSSGNEVTYALSPPAAARLARDLQKLVDEYLYGVPDEETE